MNTSRIDTDVRRSRWNATQNIEIIWTDILEQKTYDCLFNLALSTGTPIDFFVMPLLTTTASVMNGATVLANKQTQWREPSILWSVVSAPAGKLLVVQYVVFVIISVAFCEAYMKCSTEENVRYAKRYWETNFYNPFHKY